MAIHNPQSIPKGNQIISFLDIPSNSQLSETMKTRDWQTNPNNNKKTITKEIEKENSNKLPSAQDCKEFEANRS